MAAIEIVAVLDAGPLIHLDELGRVDLLADFGLLLIPQIVLEEALQSLATTIAGVLSAFSRWTKGWPTPAWCSPNATHCKGIRTKSANCRMA
jgi:hypothetical protein